MVRWPPLESTELVCGRGLWRWTVYLQSACFLLSLTFSLSLQANRATPRVDIVNLGKINVTNQGLIEGEHIDLRTGAYYWETTDLVIPGNGKLDITVSRSFNKVATSFFLMEFQDWQLEVPRIINAVDGSPMTKGEVEAHPKGGGLCGEPSSPSVGSYQPKFWSGLQLVIPGEAPRELFF
jgi:hypothetical protein